MKSETKFIWEQLLFIILLPITLIQVVFKKKPASSLFQPFTSFYSFLSESRITFWLIIINLVMFLVEILLLFTYPEVLPTLIFQPQDLWQLNVVPIISSWFLHAGLLHLFGNMIFLFVFGRVVEAEYGWKMLLIYFFSAITADVVSAVAGWGGIGASGAIAGIIATGILLQPFRFTYIAAGIPLPLAVVGFLAIVADITGVLLPQQTNVNHFAHLGGYVAVLFVVFLSSPKKKEQLKKGMWVSLAIVLFAFLLQFLLPQFF